MPVLYVTEYVGIAAAHSGNSAQVPQEPVVVEQAIAITSSSTQTAAFNSKTTLIRVHADSICGVTIGTNPTATVSAGGLGSGRFVAGQTEFRGVFPGQKAAVIATT
jgi:hypothetical protein